MITERQQARLAWLLKNRPKDPQVKELQAMQSNTGAGTGAKIGSAIDPGAGAIDLNVASNVTADNRAKDAALQFARDNPDETDEYGNTVRYTQDPATGKTVRTVTEGDTAKRFRQLALSATEGYDPATDSRKAEDATYSTLTKYYDRDKQREMEEQKQELANRGIPYNPAAVNDPNTNDLYGKTLGSIDQKYQGYKEQAGRDAITSGNQAFATTSAARDSFSRTAAANAGLFGDSFRQYVNNVTAQSGNDDLTLLSMSADQYAKLRNISVQEAAAKRADATNRYQIKTQAATAKAGQGASSGSGGGFEFVG